MNHLAPFLLTNLLREVLLESRASVIQTSSAAARLFSRFDIDDLQGEHRYSASRAYGNAKLANVLFTKELNRRFGDAGLSAVAYHPGVIASSFGSTGNGSWKFLYGGPLAERFMTSTDVGGAVSLARARQARRRLAARRLLRQQQARAYASTRGRPRSGAAVVGPERRTGGARVLRSCRFPMRRPRMPLSW